MTVTHDSPTIHDRRDLSPVRRSPFLRCSAPFPFIVAVSQKRVYYRCIQSIVLYWNYYKKNLSS